MNKPTVIVLASQKGGVGKTTLAAHLAVAADASGIGAVAVYDTDPQQSLARWWDRREAETPYYARGGVDELGKPFAFALTMVKAGTHVAADGARVLSSFGTVAAIVGDRTGIATSMNRGGTTLESDPKGRGADEIRQLWEAMGSATGLLHRKKKAKQHV